MLWAGFPSTNARFAVSWSVLPRSGVFSVVLCLILKFCPSNAGGVYDRDSGLSHAYRDVSLEGARRSDSELTWSLFADALSPDSGSAFRQDDVSGPYNGHKSVSKRSLLTKVPAWVKWSMETSALLDKAKADRSAFTEEEPPGPGERRPRDLPGSITRPNQPRPLDPDAIGKKNSNLPCFFNPVSCFGRRQSRSRYHHGINYG